MAIIVVGRAAIAQMSRSPKSRNFRGTFSLIATVRISLLFPFRLEMRPGD